jgi:hypothetical protein
MTGRGALAGVAVLLWALAPAAAFAQDPYTRELADLRTNFEHGKYREVLDRARELIQQGLPDEQTLIELNKYAGLSAFNLEQLTEAESHLSALLRLDPGFSLDPFVFPPATINFLEKVRKKLKPELDAIRQERLLEGLRKKRAEEERERIRREAEEQRRRIDELTRRITVRTVEKRSFLVNFVPFGAGQFQQGRTTLGAVLAASEGALAAASLVAYVGGNALVDCKPYTFDDRLNPTGQFTITLCGIPPERSGEAQVWNTLRLGAGAAFYALWTYGVVDALIHHRDQVVSTETLDQAPAPPPPGIPSVSTRLPSPRAPPGPVAYLFPLPGGLGAGLTLTF